MPVSYNRPCVLPPHTTLQGDKEKVRFTAVLEEWESKNDSLYALINL